MQVSSRFFSLFDIMSDGCLTVPLSRTVTGRRRFGVVGAELFNNTSRSPETLDTPGIASSRSGGRRVGQLQLLSQGNSTPQLMSGKDKAVSIVCPLLIVFQPSS